MNFLRRQFLKGSLASVATILARPLSGQEFSAHPIISDDGKPVLNYRLPPEPSIGQLPGIVWTGSATPDVILIEFYDYNCPFCRPAATDLDALVSTDPDLRLGLVNNPILSPASMEAARVQQAVLKHYGPARATELHLRLFQRRGVNNRAAALETAGSMGLDVDRVASAAQGGDVERVLGRQKIFAEDMGFTVTPAFMVNAIGVLGYPGPRAMGRMITALRSCDKPACP
jgi:protein-disulfide isomerase